MNQRKALAVFLLICVVPLWLGCGEEPAMVRNRIKFLMLKEKKEEALEAALKGAETVSKSGRGEVLLDAATIALRLYREGGQKSRGQQAMRIVQTVIDEKLILDGRPFFIAARVFQQDKKLDQAIKFFRRAEDLSKSDPQQAGLYRYYLIEMLWNNHEGDQLLREAKEFRTKYPRHDRLSDVEKWAENVRGSSG